MTDNTQVVEKEPKQEKQRAELVAGADIKAIVPRNINEMHRMAQSLVIAGLVPDSYAKDGRTQLPNDRIVPRVMIGIQTALEVGLPPLMGLRNIMIVNNRPTIWGDAAIALVQSKGVLEKQEVKWSTDDNGEDKCLVLLYRKGQSEPYTGEFSMSDAKRAKLNTRPGPWMTYPKRMIFNRARAFAIRDGFADCLSGLSIREEVDDIPTKEPEMNTDFLEDETQEITQDAKLLSESVEESVIQNEGEAEQETVEQQIML